MRTYETLIIMISFGGLIINLMSCVVAILALTIPLLISSKRKIDTPSRTEYTESKCLQKKQRQVL
ncbi:putative holin-like toxin [Bacillus paralicheniformis]|uniref:putative holin-like toxin n=1 Tax=Bacillus paralicheniformis TaxID=1648923 RepID=UPI0034DCC6C1